MNKETLKRDASISFHCEFKRKDDDNDKSIYMAGYHNGYHHALNLVQSLLHSAPNNKMRIELINELINNDYGQR